MGRWVEWLLLQWPEPGIQCNGVYKILLTTSKILSGYFFAGTRTSGGYHTPVYSILLNIATKLELQKATHGSSKTRTSRGYIGDTGILQTPLHCKRVCGELCSVYNSQQVPVPVGSSSN